MSVFAMRRAAKTLERLREKVNRDHTDATCGRKNGQITCTGCECNTLVDLELVRLTEAIREEEIG